MRATVVMEEGKALEEEKLKESFKKNNLEFVSLAVTKTKPPKAAWVLQASGGG